MTHTISNKTILITGGAGFIGSSLAETLSAGNNLILYDRTFRERPIEFTMLASRPHVRLVEGDVVTDPKLSDWCCQADIVIHTAAVVGVERVCNAARETLDTNYVGTSRLLKALEVSQRLKCLVYFSTSEVFGVNSFRVDERAVPHIGPVTEARWSYAVSKLAGEHLAGAYFRELNMPIVIVRPFNIFGPRRIGDHALLQFVVSALEGRPLKVHGDGSQIRSWCYIDDFCSAVIAMLERHAAVGQDFNIGHPANTLTIVELAHKVVALTRSSSPVTLIAHPFPDVSIRVPSITKAEDLLGYLPQFDIERALTLTIAWYRTNLDQLAAQLGSRTKVDRLSQVREPSVIRVVSGDNQSPRRPPIG